MAARRNPETEAAVQYLTWALEATEQGGHRKAAYHVRLALDELRGVQAGTRPPYAEEAKRFRDKADEAEQMVELAETASRRDALMEIVKNYRRTAEQMDRLSEAQKTRKANS
jgi:hypothetical protein